MDIEAIVERFVEQGRCQADVRKSIDKYMAMPLTLPVSDERMQRISQVLTNNSYITEDTCEGHGKELPHVYLHCKDQDHVRHLAHILARESYATNFRWLLAAWSGAASANPDSPLYYNLTPNIAFQDVNPKRDHNKLLQDLDIIGISVMEYFQ